MDGLSTAAAGSGGLLAVLVTAVDLPARDGAQLLLRRGCGYGQTLRLIWIDGAYRGSLQDGLRGGVELTHKELFVS